MPWSDCASALSTATGTREARSRVGITTDTCGASVPLVMAYNPRLARTGEQRRWDGHGASQGAAPAPEAPQGSPQGAGEAEGVGSRIVGQAGRREGAGRG